MVKILGSRLKDLVLLMLTAHYENDVLTEVVVPRMVRRSSRK